MPANEAGLSEGHDLGDGGHTPASDMPAENAGGPPASDDDEAAGPTGDPAEGTGPGD